MIHLIITTANILPDYRRRKQQYIESIESCLKYSNFFDSYTVLECVSKNEQYLNNYNVFYSKEGNAFSNKGLNEMNHLRAFLNQSSFSDNDVIIKLSGRYLIQDSFFLKKVYEQHSHLDSILKEDSDVYEGRGYHTFLYYMKKWLLEDTINKLDFSHANDTPIEWHVKECLKHRSNHFEIERLGITAYQGTFSEKVFEC